MVINKGLQIDVAVEEREREKEREYDLCFCVKERKKKLRADFANVLRGAFTLQDPKSAKRHS